MHEGRLLVLRVDAAVEDFAVDLGEAVAGEAPGALDPQRRPPVHGEVRLRPAPSGATEPHVHLPVLQRKGTRFQWSRGETWGSCVRACVCVCVCECVCVWIKAYCVCGVGSATPQPGPFLPDDLSMTSPTPAR